MTHVSFSNVWGKCVCKAEEMQNGRVLRKLISVSLEFYAG